MEFIERESGIVVPVSKTPPEPASKPRPHRRYGLLEIQDETRRELAHEAMELLWKAMDLSSGGGIINRHVHEEHYRLYHYVGEMLLGDELPEHEMKC